MAATTEPADGGPGLLDDAREALRVERRRVADEREALRAFRGRVASVPSEPVQIDGGIDIPTYLYQGLDATYPVLATIAVVGDRLDDLKGRIERAMARAS